MGSMRFREALAHRRVALARRARMDRIEVAGVKIRARHVFQDLERIAPHERERVVRLRLDVHADNLEACAVVAHRRAAGAAEEVEEPWLAHAASAFGPYSRSMNAS